MALLPDLSDGNIIYAADINARYDEIYLRAADTDHASYNATNHGNLTFSAGKYIVQDAWTALTPSGGWSNFGGQQALQYRKLKDGNVHVRGVLAGGTTTDGTTIFTMPSGFRPPAIIAVNIVAIGDAGPLLQLLTTGAALITNVTANTYLHVHAIYAID